MDLDLSQITDADTLVDLNPYQYVQKIWEVVNPYLEKYNVEFTRYHGSIEITRPTIVWLISRVPSDSITKHGSLGANEWSSLGSVEGKEIVAKSRTVLMYITFIIAGAQGALLDDLCWDFENALESASPNLKEFNPANNMVLERVNTLRPSLWNLATTVQGYELEVKCILRLRSIQQMQRVNAVHINEIVRAGISYEVLTREDDTEASLSVYLSPNAGLRVTNIGGVYLYLDNSQPDDSTAEELIVNTDYTVHKDPETQNLYLKWDTLGKIPAVGDSFKVVYQVSSVNTKKTY